MLIAANKFSLIVLVLIPMLTYSDNFQRCNKMKFILLWTGGAVAPFKDFMSGQEAFISYNCSVQNCFVIRNRTLYLNRLDKFHAILFNGRCINTLNTLPKKRYPFQKYVFVNTESSDNYPMCNNIYDNGFFNWTVSYKLNSDIIYPYMLIKDIDGKVIGPKRDMNWPKKMKVVDPKFSKSLRTKTKGVAWFVSNCRSRSRRLQYVQKLQKALNKFNIKIDIYGKCGNLKCPRDMHEECIAMLKKHYHFYLAMENTFAEDYVTEKVLHALQGNVIPIVYGGANYSRFLPPGSYLDCRLQNHKKLAKIINKLIVDPKFYQKYFNWRSHFTYNAEGYAHGVCKLCEMLNDRSSFENYTSHTNFMQWWHQRYKGRCAMFEGY